LTFISVSRPATLANTSTSLIGCSVPLNRKRPGLATGLTSATVTTNGASGRKLCQGLVANMTVPKTISTMMPNKVGIGQFSDFIDCRRG
jgi:hypothetical protein